MYKINKSTIIQLGSAFVFALIMTLPSSGPSSIIGWIIRRIGFFADVLFHETGHAVFAWLYGIPAAPGIMTIFGSDQAGGMTMPLGPRTWFLQIAMLVLLGWFCNNLRKVESYYLYPFAGLFGFIAITCLTGYHHEIISYMGHGGAVFAGGVLLFMAFSNTNMRHGVERWLNAFFGMFLILENFFFAYELIYDAAEKLDYTTHKAFGMSNNDFAQITQNIPSLSVENLAWFTISLCVSITALAAFLAYLVDKEKKFLAMPEPFIKTGEVIKKEDEKTDFTNF